MKKRICLVIAAVTVFMSTAGCAGYSIMESDTSTGSAVSKYREYLSDNLSEMPDELVIASGDEAAAYGIDMSDISDEGFITKSDSGKAVILAKTDAGLDRAVRDFVKYGNSDSYAKTYGEGYRVKRLTIVGNDISEYTVIRDDYDYNGMMAKATSELVTYIEKTCGVTLPSYTVKDDVSPEDFPEKYIRLTVDYPNLGNEAFRIEVDGDGNLTVYGGRVRGCLYGVYELLEVIGWRFIDDVLSRHDPDDVGVIEYLYESKHVDLTAEINREEHPLFDSRRQDDTYESSYNLADKERIAANWYSGHGLNQVDYTGTSFEGFEHKGFQPCLTDEEILERIDEHVLAYVKRALDAGHVIGRDFFGISLGQYDMAPPSCMCEGCMKLIAEEGSTAGLYVRLANREAQLLKDNDYGDVHINILAYAGNENPPKTEPLDNVRIAFCFYLGEHSTCNVHPIDGEDCDPTTFAGNTYFAEKFEEWVEICAPGNLDVWYYPFHNGNTIVQAPMITNLYYDIKYLSEHGVNAIINTTFSTISDSQIQPLTAYLLNEICWQLPETFEDYLELIREWFFLTYGDAGEPLYEYFMEYERLGKTADCYTVFYDTASPEMYLPKNVMAANFDYFCELFDEAKRIADTEGQLIRIEHFEAGMLYLGVSLSYDAWYVNGTEEEREKLIERYERLHYLMKKYNIHLFAKIVREKLAYAPDTLDLDVNPLEWFYEASHYVEST